MKHLVAVAAIAATTVAAEPKMLQKWKEYEAPQLPKHHPEAAKIHHRGFKAQERMTRKLHSKGYPVSRAEHKMMEAEGSLHPRLM